MKDYQTKSSVYASARVRRTSGLTSKCQACDIAPKQPRQRDERIEEIPRRFIMREVMSENTRGHGFCAGEMAREFRVKVRQRPPASCEPRTKFNARRLR